MKRANNLRRLAALALLGGFALAAVPAESAQVYSMTGRFARSNGSIVDIPLIGNNPGNLPNCGYTKAGAGMTMVPGAFPIVAGINSTQMMTKLATKAVLPQRFANPNGCVSGAGMITATAAGAGKAFTFPVKAFSKPLPGTTLALEGGLIAVQLATSFQVTAPPAMLGTGPDAPAGTMGNGMNTAMFRVFHASAWKTQPAAPARRSPGASETRPACRTTLRAA